MDVEGPRIARFLEKRPTRPDPGNDSMALASMGNYVFDTETLLRAITEDAADEHSKHDLGGNIIPNLTVRAWPTGTTSTPTSCPDRRTGPRLLA